MPAQLLQGLFAQVSDRELEPRLDDVDGHRLANAAKAYESHFHFARISKKFVLQQQTIQYAAEGYTSRAIETEAPSSP